MKNIITAILIIFIFLISFIVPYIIQQSYSFHRCWFDKNNRHHTTVYTEIPLYLTFYLLSIHTIFWLTVMFCLQRTTIPRSRHIT